VTKDATQQQSFRELLEARGELGWRPATLGDRFQPIQTRRVAEQVIELLGDREPRVPQGWDLTDLRDRVARAWRADGSLASLSGRDFRALPWVLFYPRDQKKLWLGRNVDLIRDYRRWLVQGRRPRAVVALLHEFLATYPTTLSTFDELRALLRETVLRSVDIGLSRWRRRCEELHLLDRNGHGKLAAIWWKSEHPVTDFFDNAGFSGGLESCGYLEEATAVFLQQLCEWLSQGKLSPTTLAQALSWIEDEGRLRFETLRIDTAKALLSPFETQKPAAEIELALRQFLLRCLGDPRLPQETRWAGVPEKVKRVMYRWLVSLDLDDFFRLLDKTALDRQWRYRKAFWSAYLERDLITDTWIILGSQAAKIARRTFEHGDKAAGRLRSGAGVQGNHSVLLMRLGRMTVAEWSHNGTCRFWLYGNSNAPVMYREEYERDELVHWPDFDQRHQGAERGAWQVRIADWIYQNTSVRVLPNEYMPTRRGRRS